MSAGWHTRLVPIGASYLQGIDLQSVTEDAEFCVVGATVVRALQVDERTDRCLEVDWFGRAGRPTDCP